ncbi:P-loop containing nucleoside triphosphate hydrolase [Pseudocohnilembus persalinus]|uniref:p-loop containing nucleoside triphosphate hydrolase n=1 Tax=Pseudocohnilembus persalinus TaxID=266149 RepID=A0A0V0Q9V1_PSEPJ|nr:P-loop containing nucleoside triphosphate hydrolase [Pseudocohnilembus persalinus]|eukprot:KRW99021.1 P-loop containing nucleoside triphosphate hydrolase [Pseudocohnilembus persalinus]
MNPDKINDIQQGNHLKCLLKKNFILWRRNLCVSICEIFFPVVMCSFFAIFVALKEIEKYNEQSYLVPEKIITNINQVNYYPALSVIPFNFYSEIPDQADLPSYLEQIVNDPKDMVFIQNCINNKKKDDDDDELIRNGYIALSPQSAFTQKLAQIIQQIEIDGENFQVQYYQNQKDLKEYIQSEDYANDICLGIIFEEEGENDTWTYHLQFNTTFQGYDPQVPQTEAEEIINYSYENVDDYFKPWATSGFTQLQMWIDTLILQSYGGSNINKGIAMTATSFRTPEYQTDNISAGLQGQMGIFLVFPCIVLYLRMTYSLILEKEKKIKESMKIMGNIIAMVFFLGTNVLAMSVSENSSKNTKTIFSFFSQIAVSFSSDSFLLLQSKGEGVSFGNIDEDIQNYSVGISLYMMAINAVVFCVLGIYFDLIFPNEFGKKLHPLFCFPCLNRNDKKKFQKQFEEDKEFQEEFIEQVNAQLKEKEKNGQALKIQYLVKKYPNGKVAVNNLNFTMYKDQISCLLGHNGAGKTTTISILTGMLKMTSGNAVAFGLDIEKQMDKLRKIMGICPQHDILFDNLTCAEHLEMFAAFKGCPKEQVQEQIDQLLDDVSLAFKKNELAKNLSGGQKRRLSVAIAFIGGSKLIYLDEPTSGCDTEARRHIWEMLRKYKQDRIVVLTTHFMDEADFLGDRIAIIGNGKLLCMGSPVFLKNKFGTGYNLCIIKEDNMVESGPIIGIVKQIIPEAKILSQVSAELQFQLSMNELPKFENLFTTLDENKQQLKIANYGISITSMEEVFLRVAELEEGKEKPAMLKEDSYIQEKIQEASQLRLRNSSFYSERNIDDSKKNIEEFLDSSQNSEINCTEENLQQNEKNQKKEVKNQKKAKNLEKDEYDDFDINSVRITAKSEIFWSHFKILCWKRLIYFSRDKRGIICELILPLLIIIFGLFISSQDFTAQKDPQKLNPYIYDVVQPVYFGNDYQVSENYYNGVIQQFDNNILELNYADLDGEVNEDRLEQFDLVNFQKMSQNSKGAYYLKESKNDDFQYFMEINSVNKNAMPIYTNSINQAIIRYATQNDDILINVYNDPLPITQQYKRVSQITNGIITAYIFSMALAFIPASLITFTVKEREDQVKHQQLVSGVSLKAYWGSNWFIDIIKFLFVFVFSVIIIKIYDIETYTGENETFVCVILAIFLYSWSMIPFSYCFGFVFKDHGNSQITTFFLHFILGSTLTMVVYILKLINSTSTIGEIIQWPLRFVPSYAFGSALINIGGRNLLALINGKSEPDSAFSFNVAGADILFLAITGVLYSLLIFLIEKYISKGSLVKAFSHENDVPYQPKLLDDDVREEAIQVATTSPEKYTIRINQLRKVFKTRQGYNEAVDNLSLGIKNGEVFTLLGQNGAGKTTTFKILSGDIQPTSGEAHIQGYDLQTNMREARKYIGYCPQFDALLDKLTSKEHLYLYCAIKGIPKKMHKKLVEKKIKEMDLSKFENVQAGTYSGGNKRKLSVAIAMIGNPPIVFLDEPSTGIDPKARRYMWSVISKIATERKRSSIILTTHSMEEAEALSTKIAVMVKGQLKCLGPIQHIKSKFGHGYELEIKLLVPTQKEIEQVKKIFITQIPNKNIRMKQIKEYLQKINYFEIYKDITVDGEAASLYQALLSKKGLSLNVLGEYVLLMEKGNILKKFIERKFGEYTLIEHFQGFYRFQVTQNIPTGKIFGAFEKEKHKLDIASYSIKQATIEQIFNRFVKGEIKTKDYNNVKSVEIQQQLIENKQISQNKNSKSKSDTFDIELQTTNKFQLLQKQK